MRTVLFGGAGIEGTIGITSNEGTVGATMVTLTTTIMMMDQAPQLREVQMKKTCGLLATLS
eukprot:7085402-Karenia_brevis.AAC.1